MQFKLAWRNLWRNKRRTIITMASVFFAVLLATFMRSLQEGVYDQMTDNVVGTHLGYAQVHAKGYWDEPAIDNSFAADGSIAEKLRSVDGVTGLVPRIESMALATEGEISRPAMILGVDPELEDALTGLAGRIEKGKYLQKGRRQALVAIGLAEKLKLGVGDSLILLGQGYHAAPAAGLYEIAGTISFGSPDLNARMVYLPIDQAEQMFACPGRLTAFVLQLKDPDKVDAVVKIAREKLGEDLEVLDWKEMQPQLVQMIEADRGGGVLMISILYLVVGFGMFGTILMMTAERKYEFGVMVAIGMKRRLLAMTVVLETVFISILGVLAGSAVSLPIVVLFNVNPLRIESMAEAYAEFGLEPILPTAVDPGVFLTQALVVLFVAVLISAYPAIRILRLKAIDSMKH